MKLVALLVSLFFSAALFAQNNSGPDLDVYGAYAHGSNFGIGQSGWLGSAAYNFSNRLAAEADLSGGYGSKSLGPLGVIIPGLPNTIHSHMHSFDVGPRVMFRNSSDKADAFGHLLFGFSHTNVSAAGASQSDTSFSWALGGGADYFFKSHLGARVQLDWLRTNFFSQGDNHARFAIGLVYSFRGR